MSQLGLQMPRKRGPKRDDKAVKIDRDLATKAKFISETMGIPIAEYLSNMIRPLIEKDWPKALKRLEDAKASSKSPSSD